MSPPPVTLQLPRPPPHSTTRGRSPPRTAADAHVATPPDDQGNASEDATPDPTDDAFSFPSRLLTLEVLRRPFESALTLRSEWWTNPSRRVPRCQRAISKASRARSALRVLDTRQPRIRLENTSVTKPVWASYTRGIRRLRTLEV